MRVSDISMLVNEIRLAGEANLFHIFRGDGNELFAGQMVIGVEIEGNVQGITDDSPIEVDKALEALNLVGYL